MATPDLALRTEEQIGQWRNYLRRRQAIHTSDVDELEDHLREQVASLSQSGLSDDEAFLVAVKRMGDLDTLSREFAQEHSERLWKQLVVGPGDSGETGRGDTLVAFCLAAIAALAIKAPELFGVRLDENPGFYVRNLGLFVLPLLTGYFAWKHGMPSATVRWMAAAFVAAAFFANIYPFAAGGYTEVLTMLHLPI